MTVTYDRTDPACPTDVSWTWQVWGEYIFFYQHGKRAPVYVASTARTYADMICAAFHELDRSCELREAARAQRRAWAAIGTSDDTSTALAAFDKARGRLIEAQETYARAHPESAS